MLDHGIVLAGAGLLALSSLPGAYAKKVCVQDKTGTITCRDTLPLAAKVALAVVSVSVLFLSLTMCFCMHRHRRISEATAREYNVEASQMAGPPTVLHATYNPASGHSIYAIGSSGTGGMPTSVIPPTATPVRTAPPLPPRPFPMPTVPVALYSPSPWVAPPQTAPANRSTFPGSPLYPFTMGSNANGSMPKSAFVSGGFPRPLLAGRLKDRIRERPPSQSGIPVESPNK